MPIWPRPGGRGIYLRIYDDQSSGRVEQLLSAEAARTRAGRLRRPMLGPSAWLD